MTALLDRFVDRARAAGGRVGALVLGSDGSEALALDEVLRLLERNTNATRLGRYLPKGVTLAHKDGWGDDPQYVDNDAGIVKQRSSVVAVGFTYQLEPVVARPLLGLLGLAAAELAGADVSALPLEAVGAA